MPVQTLSTSSKTVSHGNHPEHVLALDGIRGLAIMMVLGIHLLWSNISTGNSFFDLLSEVRASLWVGVDLFFALSGFLITGILFDSLHKERYFLNFYVRRALRIFPLYYGFLLVLICLTHPLHLHWEGKQYLLLTYTQNLGIWTKDYTGFRPAPFINLNHFWSLAVEEQFYLVWPLIIFLVRDLRKLLFVALGLSLVALILRIVLVSRGELAVTIYQFTPCRMDALLLGGSLALLYRSRFRTIVLRNSVPVFLVFFGCLLCLAYRFKGLPYETVPLIETVGFPLVALTSTALIACALSRVWWAQIGFENPILRFMGKYSYGIYVFHYSLDAALTAPLRRWLLITYHSKAIAVVLGSVPVVALTILIAYVSYHLYEKRFLHLKRYFEPKRNVSSDSAILS